MNEEQINKFTELQVQEDKIKRLIAFLEEAKQKAEKGEYLESLVFEDEGLTDEQLKSLLPHILALKEHLSTLIISGNSITKIPDELCELNNLETLIISDNPNLTSLPLGLKDINSLKNVFLTDNDSLSFDGLDEEIKKDKLVVNDPNAHLIQGFYKVGKTNRGLAFDLLIINRIQKSKAYEEEAMKHPYVQVVRDRINKANEQNSHVLDLSKLGEHPIPDHVLIVIIDNLLKDTEFKTIKFSNNGITRLPKNLIGLSSFESVDFSGNNLKTLKNIDGLFHKDSNLKKLNVSNNRGLYDASALANVRKLGVKLDTLLVNHNTPFLTQLPVELIEEAHMPSHFTRDQSVKFIDNQGVEVVSRNRSLRTGLSRLSDGFRSPR